MNLLLLEKQYPQETNIINKNGKMKNLKDKMQETELLLFFHQKINIIFACLFW